MVLFAGLAFTLGLCITLYIGKTASAQMSKSSGQTLYIAAKSISNTLANSLTEREREMVLLSQSPFIAEADFNNPRVQQQLDQVKKSYQYYAWLGIANLKVKSKLRQTIYCKVQMYLSGIGLFTAPSEYIWAMYTRLFYSPKKSRPLTRMNRCVLLILRLPFMTLQRIK
jgi:hypothetical protein